MLYIYLFVLLLLVRCHYDLCCCCFLSEFFFFYVVVVLLHVKRPHAIVLMSHLVHKLVIPHNTNNLYYMYDNQNTKWFYQQPILIVFVLVFGIVLVVETVLVVFIFVGIVVLVIRHVLVQYQFQVQSCYNNSNK